jgi:hypothetical protein
MYEGLVRPSARSARPAQPGGFGGVGDGVGLGVGGALALEPAAAGVCRMGSPPLGLLPAFGTAGMTGGVVVWMIGLP